MRLKLALLVVISLIAIAGCYKGITGTVVDANTGQPIEGAVVLVEWTKTKGIGFTATYSYKVAEVVTDRDGKFKLPGVYYPFVDAPRLTIYKKGYVAWNNEYVFPGYKRRASFKWEKGNLYKLERFNMEYGFIEHESFINGVAYLFSESDKKKLFLSAYHEWEMLRVIEERRAKVRKR